ncbi:carbonic anhydrase 1-like [Uloborus diversus]|uniref:carbonic anhydrase 1-like n=1 Tax=Uloborus diversus TaxID=327109 RepID=UPI002409D4C5|nr:carbonic anhydrase 1-like [Uloborus diversus]
MEYVDPTHGPASTPHAGGKSQSPVDIVSSRVKAVEFDNTLQFKYGPDLTKTIINTGCGWRVDVHGTQSELVGGPLSHAYELVQFHCHWGNTNSVGSEHTVDGKAFAGELHFVHWNKEAFASCAEAVPSPKGLTVIGVLLEVGEENPEIQKLCDVLPNIPVKDDRTDLPSDIDPAGMYPADRSFWTYSGSLTTPPCYESVTWILFKNPITVSEEQLNCFRQMRKTAVSDSDEVAGLVERNFRPSQSLNDREICECAC